MTVEETLRRWQAEEDAVRERIAARGGRCLDRSTTDAMSGLEILQARLRGELPGAPIGETLDFLLLSVAEGRAVFQGRPRQAHYNPHGIVHGGWFATLLDSAVGCAIQTTLPAGRRYTTLELKLNMVRPLTDAVPLVRAEGSVLHAGRRTATADGRLLGPDGRLYGHATTTCLVFDAA